MNQETNMVIKGCVVKGEQLGRKIGFPTANVSPTDENFPYEKYKGVYLAEVLLIDRALRLYGMLNIGKKPSVGKHPYGIEVHLFDFDQNIYKHKIEIKLLSKLRDEKTFENIDQLISQLHKDKKQAISILNQ